MTDTERALLEYSGDPLYLKLVKIVAILLILGTAFVIDAILTPFLLALPAILVMVHAPAPWHVAGLLLMIFPVIYILLYLFIRDTDPEWPVGPAERIVFGSSDPEDRN